MKRKIVMHGNTSLTISLPIKWAKKYSLSKGDEVEIEEKNSNLVIGTKKGVAIEKKEIDVSGLNRLFVRRTLSALHKSGYDEIKVFFKDPKIMDEIRDVIDSTLLGFEIIDQGENYCLIKNISKGLEEEFENILRRVFLVTITMANNIADLLDKGDYKNLKSVISLEQTNNKLTNFCERLLNKQGYKDYRKTTFVYCVVWQLEKIADSYKYLINYISDKNIKMDKDALSLLKETNELLRMFYELYYKLDDKKLLVVTEKRNEIIKKINGSKEKSLNYIYNLTEQIFDLSGPILGIGA